jgi:hypothetical protein
MLQYKYGSTYASIPSYSTERLNLEVLLKTPSVRLNTCLGTAYNGMSNKFKDTMIVAQCTSEMSLDCELVLNKQGLISAPTGKNPEESKQLRKGATQWVLLSLSICYDIRILLRTSCTTQMKCAEAPSCINHVHSPLVYLPVDWANNLTGKCGSGHR